MAEQFEITGIWMECATSTSGTTEEHERKITQIKNPYSLCFIKF